MTTDNAVDGKPDLCTDCMVGQGRSCHCIEPMRSSDVWILFAIVVVDLAAVLGVVWLAWRALA